MHWLLLIVFVLGIIFSVSAGQVTLAYALAALFIADLIGGVVSKFFSGLGAIAAGVGETIEAEGEEVAAAKTKNPAGKKFIDEGLSRIAKETGKREKDKKEGKKMKQKLGVDTVVGAVDNFMTGFSKLFRK